MCPPKSYTKERNDLTEQTISMERMEEAVNIFGTFDENIRIIERELWSRW